MSDSIRRALVAGVAVVVALSLIFSSVAAGEAGEADESMAPMASMEPMASMAPGLVVRDPWTRQSMMLELAGAAYMIIHNGTDADDALIGASSPAAEVVELHLSAMDEAGMMSMAQVPEIPVPAGEDVVLEPGGYHVMLIDLVEPLVEGGEIELSLEFASAGQQTLSVPVRASGPMGMDMGDGEDGMDAMPMHDPAHDEDEDEG